MYLHEADCLIATVRLLRQDKGSGRRAAVTRAIEAAGGKVEAFYFAYGQDDTIIIADYPDAASATAMSLVGNSTGVVRVSMTPLITVEEMDRAVNKAATLPSPAALTSRAYSEHSWPRFMCGAFSVPPFKVKRAA